MHTTKNKRKRAGDARKDADIVAVHSALHQVLGVLKHLALGGGRGEDCVKVELALLSPPDELQAELVWEGEGLFLPGSSLEVQNGANSRIDPDLALHILHLIEDAFSGHALFLHDVQAVYCAMCMCMELKLTAQVSAEAHNEVLLAPGEHMSLSSSIRQSSAKSTFG